MKDEGRTGRDVRLHRLLVRRMGYTDRLHRQVTQIELSTCACGCLLVPVVALCCLRYNGLLLQYR